MNISNLQRAAEIAEMMPMLEKARKFLSSEKAQVRVWNDGETVTLPMSVRNNVLNIINCEYERLREEVRKL